MTALTKMCRLDENAPELGVPPDIFFDEPEEDGKRLRQKTLLGPEKILEAVERIMLVIHNRRELRVTILRAKGVPVKKIAESQRMTQANVYRFLAGLEVASPELGRLLKYSEKIRFDK